MSKIKFVKGVHNTPAFYLPTGSALLNAQLNNGKGIPSGVIVQFQSEAEGSFKSSEAIKIIGEAQKQGLDTAYVDGENRVMLIPSDNGFKNDWFENLGADVNNMYFVHAGAGEEIWNNIIDLIDNYNVKLVVLDSIHSCRPTVEYDKEMGEKNIGQHASLHQQGIFKVLPLLSKHNAVLLGINQRRDNVTLQGAMGTTPSGGKSWRFYSSYNFIFKKAGSNKSFDGSEYIPLHIFIDKNSGGRAYQTIKTFAKQGYGIDAGAELGVIAEELKLIKKAGSWWKTADGETIGQGDESRFAWAVQNKDLILSLYKPSTQEKEE